MVSSYDRTIDALGRIVGLRVLEYSEDENIGRRGGMTWIGDNSMEVAEPIVVGHAAARFLERFGPGMHSYAVQVEDLDATIDHLERGGVRVGARPALGFCFTDPRTTGGLLFEWSDFTVPEDPRVGAPDPPFTTEPLLDVTGHAFVGAVVPDPIEWSERYGELFGFREAFRRRESEVGQAVIGLAAPDCLLVLYRLPGPASVQVWGAEHPRARCHVLGLGVTSLKVARHSLDQAGVRILRQTEDSILLDPAQTGQVPLMLVDRLLPGDPRSG
jgi:methylmalonyl-CoA/ethylmalonyl-CoA epimerase